VVDNLIRIDPVLNAHGPVGPHVAVDGDDVARVERDATTRIELRETLRDGMGSARRNRARGNHFERVPKDGGGKTSVASWRR
jgi:hypothetical protein